MNGTVKGQVEMMFGARLDRAPQGVEFAPGRLVLLGEHLDHQEGVVLAMPLAQGVACAWGVRPDSRVVLWAMNARAKDSFQQGEFTRSGREWADLARGACARAARGGRRMPGLDLMVMGDLPAGEGLASSAAYLVVLLRAVYAAVGEYRSRFELAQDVPAIEQEWRGVPCGPLDPLVVAGSKRPGVPLAVNCRSWEVDPLFWPQGLRAEPVATGVRRRLSDTPYAQRRAELGEALKRLQATQPGLESLCDLSPAPFESLAKTLPEPLRQRARHVVTESARVVAAQEALGEGGPQAGERLGALMDLGHRSLALDFESTTPEIDAQAQALRAQPGVLGVRLQGAGWGGSLAVLRTP